MLVLYALKVKKKKKGIHYNRYPLYYLKMLLSFPSSSEL